MNPSTIVTFLSSLNPALILLLPFGVILTTDQVAKILGVKRNQVTRLCKSGEIKAERFGKAWMIKEEDLQKYQESRPTRGGTRLGAGRPKKTD